MAASFHNMIQGLLAGLFSATRHHAAAQGGNRSSRRVQSSSSRGGSMVLPVR